MVGSGERERLPEGEHWTPDCGRHQHVEQEDVVDVEDEGEGHIDVDIEDGDEEDGEDLDVDIEALNPNAHCWLLSCNIGQLYVNPMTIMCLCDVYYLQDVWYVFLYFQDGWYESNEISSPQNNAVKKNRNTKE